MFFPPKLCLTTSVALFCINMNGSEWKKDSTSQVVELQEVVIQSFKLGANYRQIPVSSTLLGKETIGKYQLRSLKDAAQAVSNLYMPDYGSRLTSPVYIRGIGSKINSPSVGLYVDGVPYFEKSTFDFEFNEVASIEVLRGPQGTLFGRNTMGGIINIQTLSPFNHQATRIQIGTASYSPLRVSVSHSKMAGQKFGYAVGGSYRKENGFFTNTFTGKKADPLNATDFRVKLLWLPSSKWEVRLNSVYEYSYQGGYPYGEWNETEKKANAINYNAFSSYKRNMWNNGVGSVYKGKGWRFMSQTSLQHFSDLQHIDQDFSAADTYFVTQKQKQTVVSEEINVRSDNNKSYKWIFGIFGFYQHLNNQMEMEYREKGFSTPKFNNMNTSGIAGYHQSEFHNFIFKQLTLTAGIRYDFEKSATDYRAYQKNATGTKETAKFDSKLRFSQLLPKVSLLYTIRQTNLYASVSKGYKTGGFNTSFESEKDRSFKPEYSWQYEAGVKYSTPDHRLQVQYALFFIDWRQQQVYQALPSGKGAMLKNAGRSESKGMELSVAANPINQLHVNMSYGYTNARFKEYRRNEKTDYAEKYLPLVPSHTLSVTSDYTWVLRTSLIDRIIFAMNYHATGKIYWNDENSANQPFYGVLDGKISFQKGIVSIDLWGRNLLNTHYTAFYFEALKKKLAQQGKPITFGISALLQF